MTPGLSMAAILIESEVVCCVANPVLRLIVLLYT